MTTSPLLLNLGCGKRFHPDWQNLDFAPHAEEVILHDLTKPLPYADNTADACYNSHTLGHFRKDDAHRLLSEQYRVLKPGGIIRVVVPDLQQIINEYRLLVGPLIEGDESRAADYEWNRIEMHDQVARSTYGGKMAEFLTQEKVPNPDYIISRNGEEVRELMDLKVEEVPVFKSRLKPSQASYYFRKAQLKVVTQIVRLLAGKDAAEAFKMGCFRRFSGEIQWRIYDQYSLGKELKAAGFTEITRRTATDSAIPNYETFHFDTDEQGVVRKPESLYLEAAKR